MDQGSDTGVDMRMSGFVTLVTFMREEEESLGGK